MTKTFTLHPEFLSTVKPPNRSDEITAKPNNARSANNSKKQLNY